MAGNIDLRLVELLCARLCHDLAGPVGAAAAGAELFEDLGGDAVDAETLSLVAASAAGAAARLKFYRAAFGPASGGPQTASALRDAIDSYLRTHVSAAATGTAVEWACHGQSFSGEAARLILNMALLAKDCLPKGGVVAIDAKGDGAGISVVARGPASVLPDEARVILLEGGEPAGPRGAQARLTVLLAENLGAPVAVMFPSDGIAFTFGWGAPRPDG